MTRLYLSTKQQDPNTLSMVNLNALSCFRFEPCWSALAKDTNGVIFVYNPDQPNHDKDLENW